MNLIVISDATTTATEIDVVIRMFQDGLQHFHLRKPRATKRDIETYLSKIPAEFHGRIVLHSHHMLAGKFNLGGIHLGRRHRRKSLRNWWRRRALALKAPKLRVTRSFHRLSRLLDNEQEYDYVFLSPVFEGITKKRHSGGYSVRKLSRVLPKIEAQVIALGGVNATKIQTIREMGFDGLALWGAIWENKGRELEVYREVCAQITATGPAQPAKETPASQE